MTMASSSHVLVGMPAHALPSTGDAIDFNDLETSKLIAQLTLEDITLVNGSRKGKRRQDAPLTDEEIAFKIQSDYWESVIQTIDDHILAHSIRHAVAVDRPCLAVLAAIEKVAEDDHAAAMAPSQGLPLPQLTTAQQRMESTEFFEPINDTSFMQTQQWRDVQSCARPPTTSTSHVHKMTVTIGNGKQEETGIDNATALMKQFTLSDNSKSNDKSPSMAVLRQSR